MMIFLAVSTSTVAVTSDIYGILTVDKGVITWFYWGVRLYISSVPGAVHGWKPELMGKETIWVPFMRFTLKANLTNRGSVLYELAGNKVSFPACHEVWYDLFDEIQGDLAVSSWSFRWVTNRKFLLIDYSSSKFNWTCFSLCNQTKFLPLHGLLYYYYFLRS